LTTRALAVTRRIVALPAGLAGIGEAFRAATASMFDDRRES
jgi:hypothetical protein